MSRCVDAHTLTVEEIEAAVKLLPELRAFINAVEARAMELAAQGKLKEHKIVEGRSLRKWKDENYAEMALGLAGLSPDDLFQQKFLSVATAEKLMGKAAFRKLEEGLVFRTQGKAILVPNDDPRPDMNPASDFKPIK